MLWRNDRPAGEGIEVALDDQRSGNRAGLGARITLKFVDGSLQAREMRASGGYQSQNPPVAHFGIGTHAAVRELVVTWPDGSVSEFKSLQAGAGRYTVIHRRFGWQPASPAPTTGLRPP